MKKVCIEGFHAACMVGNLEMFKKLYFLYHKKIEEDNEDDDEENDNKKKKLI